MLYRLWCVIPPGGGRVGVSHGNHNVRLIVCEAKLCTDTLDQFITQRLPASQRVQNNNEVALTGGAIHRMKSASILTIMHTAALLERVVITHEADFTGLTDNIRRTRIYQVGGSTSALRNRGRGRNLTGRRTAEATIRYAAPMRAREWVGALKREKQRSAFAPLQT